MSASTETALLDVADLTVEYPGRTRRSAPFRALGGVSLRIGEGECMGLVGESGSGKTTLGRAILGLAPVTSGRINFAGRDIAHLLQRERRALASEIQVVFQDPYRSLNPSMTIGDILSEPLTAAGTTARHAQRRVDELLDQVGLPRDAGRRYPREFSGGQRQRIAIARALTRRPRLVVCDEPVSALDLTTQTRVLDLFVDIQRQTGVAYLFVTHDLGVVRYVSHRVAVMQGGSILEEGPSEVVTTRPATSYTERLLLASPVTDPDEQAARRARRLALSTL